MAAVAYHSWIVVALGMEGWSPSERGRLRGLERVWARRVCRVDARYEVMGTRPGRLGKRETELVRDWGRVCEVVQGVKGIQRDHQVN